MATHSDTTSTLKIQKSNTGNGTIYSTHYSIYYMNHSRVVYIRNHTILDLGHQKFAVDILLAFDSGYIYSKLPLTSVSGSIFAIYMVYI